MTSRCSPTSPCPCELKSSVCKPLSWVFPQLVCKYLHCIKMNDPYLGGSHLWIPFCKWVLRGIISAPGSQCCWCSGFCFISNDQDFRKHTSDLKDFYKNSMCLSFSFFCFFFLVACQCGEIVEWMECLMPNLERLDSVIMHFKGPVVLLLLMLLLLSSLWIWRFSELYDPLLYFLVPRGELGLWNIVP